MKSISPLLTNAVSKYHQLAISLSDDLATHPEVSSKEYRSSKKMVDILQQAGYEVEYPYLGYETGFRAVLNNGDGPSVAILAEYDALPGLGHACGHNVHGSMSVLAALALKELQDQFHGKIFIFGTPAEEEAGAKVGMAAQGAFDGMSMAIMIHSYSGGVNLPNMEQLSLACYHVEFRGTSAHSASAPWDGHSALAAARKFLDLIDARRECFTPDIRCNGIFTDGGQAPNIIPDHAGVRIEFRSDSVSKLKNMDEVVRKCAQGAAIALDCEVSFTPGFDSFFDMVRVPPLEQAVANLFDELERPHMEPIPPTGSSDIGNVSYRCPTIHPMLSICQEPYTMHTTAFRDKITKPPAHQAIATGAQIIAALCLRVLNDSDFRDDIYTSYKCQKEKKLS